MMTEFTPLSALLGGITLGLSALLLLLFNGRIAGISGIFSKALSAGKDARWTWFFLVGLVLGPVLISPMGFTLPQQIDISWPMLIIGGLLVGFGSRMGSGCTSGHGICGIGRLSPRSITATMIFMAVAIAVVFVVRHIAGVSA